MANEYVANRGGLDGFTADPDRFSRQAVGLHLGAPFVKTTGAQVRGGVLGAGLGYTATSGLNASLSPGVYLLPTTADIGPVEVVVDAAQTFTHDTAHASQPRSDLIIVEVNDVGTSSSTKKVRILKGTAGSGAPDPALPSSLGNGAAVAIWRVLIPAASSTLSTITDLRTYTGAINAVRIPDISFYSALPEGTVFYLNDSDRIGVRKAATYEMYARDVYMQRVWSRGLAVNVFSGIPSGWGASPTLSTYAVTGSSIGPDYVTASPSSNEAIRIVEAGAYSIRVATYMEASDSTAYQKLLGVPAEPDIVRAFDAQGRSEIVVPATYIAAGTDLHGEFNYSSGGSRNFVWRIHVNRVA